MFAITLINDPNVIRKITKTTSEVTTITIAKQKQRNKVTLVMCIVSAVSAKLTAIDDEPSLNNLVNILFLVYRHLF
jgi:hypothetical protein